MGFLTRLVEISRSWSKVNQPMGWTTFAGNSGRNHIGSQFIEILAQPSWQIPLEPIPTTSPHVVRYYNVPIEKAGESPDYPSSNFSVFVGDLVLVHDKHRIRCLDLNTGKWAWQGNQDGTFYSNAPVTNEPQMMFTPFGTQQSRRLGGQRFTLFSNGKVLVATVGWQQGIGATRNSDLVGFGLAKEGELRFGPAEVEDARWTFYGAPVCDADRCWVGFQLRDVSAQDHVACFDMRSGKQLWRTQVFSADSVGHDVVEEFANYLLTMHEGAIYFNSHLGYVATLKGDNGKIRRLTKYPRQGPKRKNPVGEPWHALRDLTPCLYFDGMLTIAPSDLAKGFVLDARSGKSIWKTM